MARDLAALDITRLMKYFAYGSNMSRARIEARVQHSVAGTVATLRGYRVAFNKPMANDPTAGEIHVGGPVLAQSLAATGLIDEYRLYLRPVVLGSGTPFFAGPVPPLHLVASDLIADDLIRLTYVPA